MKYLIIKLMICSFFSAFGQKDLKYPLALEAHFGLNTLQIKNSDPLTKTVSSATSGLGATYYFSKFFYVQTGISMMEDVSLGTLNFDTFKIPLSVGTSIKLDGAPYFLFGELGGAYREAYHVVNNLQERIHPKNGVLGFQTRLGMQFQLSQKIYSKIAYEAEYGYDSFTFTNYAPLTIDKISSISLFFGYRF